MTEAFRDEFRASLAPRQPIEEDRAYVAELELGAEPDHGGADDLVVRAQAGDARAREQLIQQYLPLIARLARGYRAEGLENVDLVQEGSLGLLRALARFDPARGVPFEAYARWWIRESLQELRSDFLRPLRLPPKALRQLAELKSEHARVYAAEHRQPSLRELSQRTEIDEGQVEALVRADAAPRSLDETVGGTEGEVGTLGDLLADPLSAEAYEEILDSVAGAQLRSLLGRLSEREQDVVASRFGLEGRETERLAEIGARLGVSTERVRQLEERALTKLRADAS